MLFFLYKYWGNNMQIISFFFWALIIYILFCFKAHRMVWLLLDTCKHFLITFQANMKS